MKGKPTSKIICGTVFSKGAAVAYCMASQVHNKSTNIGLNYKPMFELLT